MPAALLLALALGQVPPKAPPEIVANLQWVLGRPADTEWQPLHLELQSASPRDLDVEILLHDAHSRTRLSRRETVPAGGRRKLFLYLPTGRLGYGTMSLRPELSVRGPGGRELATFVLASPRGWSEDEVLLGLLGAAPSEDAGLGQGWKAGGTNVEVVRLTPDLLPDRWIGLAPLRAILLHDAPLDALSPDQARALRDYVRQGGTLLLSPGRARVPWTHPAIAAIAEIRAGEPLTRRDPPRFSANLPPLSAGAPFRWHPILNGAAYPTMPEAGIARFDAGFGRVVALPFDLRQSPFPEWTGLAPLLAELVLSTPRAELAWISGSGLPGDLGAAGGRSRALGRMLSLVNPYPSFLLLIGLSLLYLVLVGPVNYAVLRRLRMTLLLVVTVPAVSLAFLTLTLGIAYLVKGSTTTVTSVRLLAAVDGLPVARETGVTAVFSPATRQYTVTPPPGSAALPFDRLAQGADPGNAAAGPLEAEDLVAGPRFRAVAIGQWQSWALETRGLVDLGKGVRWSVRGGMLRVENGSARAIERAVFIRAGRGGFASPLGAVGPGAAAEARLDETRWAPLEDLGFDEGSLGGRVLSVPLGSLRNQYRRDEGGDDARVRRQEELLVCVLKEDGAAVEVDARRSGDSRSLTVLVVRGDEP